VYFVYFVVQSIMETTPANSAEDAQCERCGSFDVLEIAGKFLCADCVAQAGCGCAGHGNRDE
jgi:hypothetical protein